MKVLFGASESVVSLIHGGMIVSGSAVDPAMTTDASGTPSCVVLSHGSWHDMLCLLCWERCSPPPYLHDEATPLVPFGRWQLVLSADRGQGLEVLAAFALRSGALFLDIDVRGRLSCWSGVLCVNVFIPAPISLLAGYRPFLGRLCPFRQHPRCWCSCLWFMAFAVRVALTAPVSYPSWLAVRVFAYVSWL